MENFHYKSKQSLRKEVKRLLKENNKMKELLPDKHRDKIDQLLVELNNLKEENEKLKNNRNSTEKEIIDLSDDDFSNIKNIFTPSYLCLKGIFQFYGTLTEKQVNNLSNGEMSIKNIVDEIKNSMLIYTNQETVRLRDRLLNFVEKIIKHYNTKYSRFDERLMVFIKGLEDDKINEHKIAKLSNPLKEEIEKIQKKKAIWETTKDRLVHLDGTPKGD